MKPPGSSLVIANSSETIIPKSGVITASTGYFSPSLLYRQQYGGGSNSAPINISAPITIHQQLGQNSEEVAAIVAMKIGDAVAQARSASVLV